MTKTYYRVGRHIYCINFIDDKNSSALLPSSEPFKLEEAPVGEPLLFELNVDDSDRKSTRLNSSQEQKLGSSTAVATIMACTGFRWTHPKKRKTRISFTKLLSATYISINAASCKHPLTFRSDMFV